MTDKIKPHQLRAIRLRLNMNQQDFGVELGFSKDGARQRIYELEKGLKPIMPVRIKLLRALEREAASRPSRSVRLATRPEFRD